MFAGQTVRMLRHVGVLVVSVVPVAVVLAGCGLSLTTTTETPDNSTPMPTLVADPGRVAAPGLDEALAVESTPMTVDNIVMIGDSITVGSTPALEEAFADIGFDDVLIVSQNGKRIDRNADGNPSGTSVATFLTSERSDRSTELWVVALGTNDVNQYPEADLRTAIDEMLAAIPPESPLVWVDTFFGTQPDGAALVNDTIAELVERRGNATVARWSAVADGDGVLTGDGVHPREAGTELFADTVVDTVANFIGV